MEAIKYVIWGAGIYGKRAFDVIGEENIKAFIDSDEKKIGTKYCNKEVISLSQYTRVYSDCILLIAIKNYKACCEILQEQNIYTFLTYANSPGELITQVGYQELKTYILNMLDQDILYGVKGISLYSLTVYQWIEEAGRRAQLIIDKNVPNHMALLLQTYGVSYITEEDNLVNRPDIIFLCDYVNKKDLSDLLHKHKEYQYIFDCSEKIEAYYNPKLESFKNIHNGQRCFITATGPSLLVEDLDILERNKEICISMNGIFKAFNNTTWRPDYYVVSDIHFASENRSTIDSLDIPYKFVSDQCVDFWKYNHDSRTILYHVFYSVCCYDSDCGCDFSQDVARVINVGHTVTYACIQMAAYMGFKEIYLLGVDCNYDKGSRDNYFIKDDKPDHADHSVDKMLIAYQSAKKYADENGIKIYNATRGGMLEVFERVEFDSLFK